MRYGSGSKVHDKKCEKSDERVDDLREILNLVVTTANLFDDDGISVPCINSFDLLVKLDYIKNA